ncbi:MAG: hypothetical protein R3B12_03555 [Candidatus Saccharimonadales bacterium]
MHLKGGVFSEVFYLCFLVLLQVKTVEQSKYAAEKVGRAIAKSGHIITTGATVGLPFYAARAAHRAHGASIGFSPATSLRNM